MKIKNKKNNNIFEVINSDENGMTILNQGKEKVLKMSTIKKNYVILNNEEEAREEVAISNIIETEVENEMEVQQVQNEVEVDNEVEMEVETEMETQSFVETEVGTEVETQNEVEVEVETNLTPVDKVIIDFIEACEGKLAVRPTKYFTTFYKKVEGGRDKMLAECELQKRAIRFFINERHLGEHAINLSDTKRSTIGEYTYKIPYDEFNNKNLANILKVVLDDLKQIIIA